MTVFTASFSAVAATADQDLFELVPGASTRIRLLDIDIGQSTDVGDAAAEHFNISIIRGHTTSGSGGSTLTPANVSSYGRASVTVVEANNTTIATTAGTLLWASTWNIAERWRWSQPEGDGRSSLSFRRQILVAPSERLVIRLGPDPADSITLSASVMFEEIGKLGNA